MNAASLKVELSGTVGPEAIVDILSPITSDRIKEKIVHPLLTNLTNRPPLINDRCLRTILISSMEAPEANILDVIFFLSSNLRLSIGNGISADPPPEISTKTK